METRLELVEEEIKEIQVLMKKEMGEKNEIMKKVEKLTYLTDLTVDKIYVGMKEFEEEMRIFSNQVAEVEKSSSLEFPFNKMNYRGEGE